MSKTLPSPGENYAAKRGRGRPFSKGNKGRPKGVPNKSTVSTKAALIEAFEQLGGVPSLVQWATNEPTEFYRLWSKMLPLDVQHDVGVGVRAFVAEWGQRQKPNGRSD
jgi:hypothetical protein